jgi:2-methylcitrate dehydratase PrpD
VGLGRTASLQNAALANGMCGHVFDIDDGHRYSTVHLGATTIPAVMAVCEHNKLTMDDLIRGVVIGYETSIRMGRCIQPAHRNRGFHSSGTVGTLGAAMGVAAALKFSREETKAAMAAAASSAAGINEMMENVSTMKPFNIGRASHDGITAALIAKAGFVGPLDPLGGTFSFLRAMAETSAPEVLDIANDDKWNILGAYHKPYAACRHTHAAIDGALGIAAEHVFRLEDVERVTVRMYGQGVKGHAHTEIPSTVAAKMSTPFCVGLALKTGRAGIASFNEKNIKDRDILRVCEATQVFPDDELTALVPHKRAAIVDVLLKNGDLLTKRVDYAKGEPEMPMTVEDFKAKFAELATFGGKTGTEIGRITNAALNHVGAVNDLMALLR